MGVLTEVRENSKKLKELTGASIVWCKQAYDQSNYDFDKALELVVERIKKEGGKTFSLPGRSNKKVKYGKVGADVSITGDIGVIVGLACESDATAKSDAFAHALDQLILIALKEQPRTAVELLWCDRAAVGVTKHHTGAQIVEELLEEVSGVVHEEVYIDHYKLMTQTFSGGNRIALYPYNHHNGQISSICTIMTSSHADGKDTEWLKHRIASAVACYNPLCIHDYTISDSILEYVKKLEEKDLLGKTDAQAMEETSQWGINAFLDRVVLDRIKIPSEPYQELNKPKSDAAILVLPIEKVCHNNGLVVMDFERFQTEIQGLII